MFDFLGRVAAGHPWKVLAFWLVAALGLTVAAPDWNSQAQDDDIRFLPEHYPSARAHRLLEQAFPKDVCASRAIIAVERPEKQLTRADFALVDRLAAKLRELRGNVSNGQIPDVTCYRDGPVGKRLTSNDGHCTLIQVSLATPYLASRTRESVDRLEAELQPLLDGFDSPRVYITGPAGIGRDLVAASADSLDQATWATVLLVIVVLLLVYRSGFASDPLTGHPDPGSAGRQRQQSVRDRHSVRRGYGLLSVPDQPLPGGIGSRAVAGRRRAPRRAGCRLGVGGQRGYGHVRAGYDGLR
jgi:putative drug exporter of the RND superfamily